MKGQEYPTFTENRNFIHNIPKLEKLKQMPTNGRRNCITCHIYPHNEIHLALKRDKLFIPKTYSYPRTQIYHKKKHYIEQKTSEQM